jgi:hypothetical protein
MRSFLVDMIGYIIGCIIVVLISLKWILPKFDFETTEITFIILGITGGGIFFLGKRVKELLRANRYTESKNFADELAYEWRDNNGIDEAESKVKAEKDKWNDWNERLKRVVHDAECALVGSEELLHYYYHDNQAKNWYVSKIYDGEW